MMIQDYKTILKENTEMIAGGSRLLREADSSGIRPKKVKWQIV